MMVEQKWAEKGKVKRKAKVMNTSMAKMNLVAGMEVEGREKRGGRMLMRVSLR